MIVVRTEFNRLAYCSLKPETVGKLEGISRNRGEEEMLVTIMNGGLKYYYSIDKYKQYWSPATKLTKIFYFNFNE